MPLYRLFCAPMSTAYGEGGSMPFFRAPRTF